MKIKPKTKKVNVIDEYLALKKDYNENIEKLLLVRQYFTKRLSKDILPTLMTHPNSEPSSNQESDKRIKNLLSKKWNLVGQYFKLYR